MKGFDPELRRKATVSTFIPRTAHIKGVSRPFVCNSILRFGIAQIIVKAGTFPAREAWWIGHFPVKSGYSGLAPFYSNEFKIASLVVQLHAYAKAVSPVSVMGWSIG